MATLEEGKYLNAADGRHYCFAGFPGPKIYEFPEGNKWVEHLLFGDYIEIRELEIISNRVKVNARGSEGWINITDINTERVLEVNFVDIGQGDGCHIVTPDDQQIILDAGEFDQMNRYLWWRFYLYNRTEPLPFRFKVIISHSDQDHYKGFGPVFDNDKIRISHIYHNGIVERPGESSPFGTVKKGYIYSLVKDTAQMKEIITDPGKRNGNYSTYPLTLFQALKYNPDVSFSMISAEDRYLEGFDPSNRIYGKKFIIEILGPLVSRKDGVPALKTMNDAGKDKNGHSVLMKIIYGNARILLGGDINEEFGELINTHYRPVGNGQHPLQADVAKACHHGSNHFHTGFIQSVNALATVISSGDEENFSHPRPDALGAFGKWGYGDKPMIFSTEIARSNKEFTHQRMEEIFRLRDNVKAAEHELLLITDRSNPSVARKVSRLEKKIADGNKLINSNLTKYGMINLRTNGELMIIAQKLEVPSSKSKWDIQKMKYDDHSGRFERMEE